MGPQGRRAQGCAALEFGCESGKKTVPVELPDSRLPYLFLRGRGIVFFKGILF